MANRLAAATSPYLLQHADNPVDWWEWGDEAFAEALHRDRPILLSVGYSACHWCHVMAHESFEDPETARYMNEHFVSVKVDREERPDVDRIYMDAVQAMTGHGGWPMTVFATPEGKPFFAGTYYPKDDRPNFPSFRRVLESVAAAWVGRRHDIEHQAERLTEAVRRRIPPATEAPGADVLGTAYEKLRESHDDEHGGFGGAPKFPQAPNLDFLARMVGRPEAPKSGPILGHTLHRMAAGGIYDHLGGGFSRYSVDRHWLVPHFEKMLYDNALLARLYLRSWQVLGDEQFRTVAEETVGYLLRDLALPGGGFASAEDADSEGEEGKFYVFGFDEVRTAGGDAGQLVVDHLGVTPGGNFEGANILHAPVPLEVAAERHGMTVEAAAEAVAAAKGRLLDIRSRRIRPGLDDKVVTAWNGLALRALAEAGAILGRPDLLDAASRNAAFVLGNLRRDDGRLLRSWRDGRAAIPGFCEDYAAYALGLLALYQATGEHAWFRAASEIAEQMIDLFASPDGGFFDTGSDAEALITRPSELMDNPTPSANSLAAELMLQLALLTGRADLREQVDGVLRRAGRLLHSYPQAVGHLLAVLATATSPPHEVAVVGAPGDPLVAQLLDVVWDGYRHDCVLAWDRHGDPSTEVPLLAGRTTDDGRAQAYVCRDFACDAPTSEPARLRSQLDTGRR